MTWRDKVLRLVSWPVLIAGGISTAAYGTNTKADLEDELEIFDDPMQQLLLLPNTFNARDGERISAHRSHSSHSSHRSHRSSSGGVRTSPPASAIQPQFQTTPDTTPKPEPVVPDPTPQNSSMMVVRVQAALMRLGFYNGDIDGVLGLATRAALRAFQRSKGISQTGRIDVETLKSLQISIP
ncbi:MAG: peptidoglycan-binding protein [Albidovulum sp.]|nr:peptidoglycan-binding protein [Albidovulum sp.]